MNFSIDRVRSETRATSRVAHLNNSGASLPPASVVDAVVRHIQLEEALGPYEAAAAADEQANALYANAARLVGCQAEEIAFCDSASRAWNVLVYSLGLKPRDRVLVSTLEFGSALITVQHAAERRGATVEVIPADGEGRVSLESLERMLSGRPPAVVAINHAAAHSGAVNPVEDIGRLIKRVGALYLVDACQSLGQMPISVADLQCDALTATGRKWLRAPRGTGLLYVRRDVSREIDPTTADLVTADYLQQPNTPTGSRLKIRDDTRKFELWERSIAGAIGLGVALGYLLDITTGTLVPYQRILELAQYAADQLRTISRVDVWAPSKAQSGVVGFVVKGVDPGVVKEQCSKEGINISTMGDWDAPLDFERRHCSSVCRMAPHYYNEHGEIDRFIEIVRRIATAV